MIVHQLQQVTEYMRGKDRSIALLLTYHSKLRGVSSLWVYHYNGFIIEIVYQDMIDLKIKIDKYLNPWLQYQ